MDAIKRHSERVCVNLWVSVCVCVRKSYLARCWGLGPLTGASTLFSSVAHGQPDSTKTLINLSIHLSLPRFLYLSAPHPLSLPTFCLTFICVCVCIWLFIASVSVSIFLGAQGCRLIETADQDQTDFTKCLTIMLEEIKNQQLKVTTLHTEGNQLFFVFQNINMSVLHMKCRFSIVWKLKNKKLHFMSPIICFSLSWDGHFL